MQIAYNSCRNRHYPKCQASAAEAWLAARRAKLLPVPYYHVVFTLPAAIADIAYQNKAVVYDLLFRTAAETLMTVAADPKHLGARIGLTAVLHTWGSALTHHPHVHVIVPGGGLAPDGDRWIGCRPGFFLPVRVLSTLFRRLMLAALAEAHRAGRLAFFGGLTALADARAFAAVLAPLKKTKWFVYAKQPFAGPGAVLTYLSRYTHRVAISNRRLVACDDEGVRFRWKDYRADGLRRWKTMTSRWPSSSAVSSSTSCRRASTASATTASSPTASAAPPSPTPGHCWRRSRKRRMIGRSPPTAPAMLRPLTPQRRRRTAVPAAAG